ncbi:MAG TPA: type II toxin-antitoxin system HicA family toxin [Dehalococcoidia bacterium]|nr:type II toxin-antitoxin system HicA family toxin [Dehalococcoidia bacterium]
MSAKLPVLKPDEVISALEKAGFSVKRQTGSHAVLFKPGIPRPITVPVHKGDVPTGTLRAIIRQSNLTIDEFIDLL